VLEIIYLNLVKCIDKDLSASLEDIASLSGVSVESVVRALIRLNSISIDVGKRRVYVRDRLSLAQTLMNAGIELELILNSFGWSDVEELVSEITIKHGFQVNRNYRFKLDNKRYEIDIVAVRRGLVLSIDCKRWKRIPPSSVKRIVEKHLARTKALAEKIIREKRLHKDLKEVIPVVITTLHPRVKFHLNVPIVPVRMLNNFLLELDIYKDELMKFKV